MSSGADLFVVCKHCGSEVSPYVTECPYCGNRVRRRAPKLPRELARGRGPRGLSARLSWRRGASPTRLSTVRRRRPLGFLPQARLATAPYATIALVVCGCAGWIAWRGGFIGWDRLAVFGPLHGDWWKLLTYQFAYQNGLYAFVALAAVGTFGWLLERRWGSAVVVALFFGAGVTGALAATALYTVPVAGGANAAALGLLAAWAAADLRSARAGYHYEGDLLGAGAVAAVLVALPFVIEPPEASWLAGVTGGTLGMLVGLGLNRLDAER